jgi:hypothetical protein
VLTLASARTVLDLLVDAPRNACISPAAWASMTFVFVTEVAGTPRDAESGAPAWRCVDRSELEMRARLYRLIGLRVGG